MIEAIFWTAYLAWVWFMCRTKPVPEPEDTDE